MRSITPREMFSYFFYHLERVVDREASRGARRLLKSWNKLYRSAWGEPFEHTRDGFRQWWTALASAAGFLGVP